MWNIGLHSAEMAIFSNPYTKVVLYDTVEETNFKGMPSSIL